MFDAAQVIATAGLRRDVDGCSASELASALEASTTLRAALDAFEARVVAAYRALGNHGPLEASTWLRGTTRSSQREAARRVELAEQLSALPSAAAALADGTLTAEHAGALARAAQECPAIVEHVDALLGDVADRPADQFERALRTWVRDHSSDDGADAFERQRARRRVSVFRTDD